MFVCLVNINKWKLTNWDISKWKLIVWLITVFPKFYFVCFQLSTWFCKWKLCDGWNVPIHSWWQTYPEWFRKSSMDKCMSGLDLCGNNCNENQCTFAKILPSLHLIRTAIMQNAWQKWWCYSIKKPNVTKASNRIIADDMAMRTIVGEIVVQCWLFCMSQSGCGSRNCDSAELFCRNFIVLLM